MAIFCPLYSGSSGNSTYLDAGESALLIDLGVSCRAAVTALQQLGADFSKLKGILITHEHSDHIKGLRVFLKKYPLPLYASEPVLEYLRENVELPAGLPMYEADPEGFCVGQMMVRPFATSHDSVGSLGYRISLPDGQELGWQTDGGQGMQTLCPKQNVRLRVVQVGDAACAEMISAAESARVDTNVKIFLFIGFPSLLFFLRQCVAKGKL